MRVTIWTFVVMVLAASCGGNGGGPMADATIAPPGTDASTDAVAVGPDAPAPDASADCDVDGDGHASVACGGDDCDDTLDAVHPGATETWLDEIAAAGVAPAFVIDGAGVRHLVYADIGVRYANDAGGAWTSELADPTGTLGSLMGLAVDGLGHAHVVFTETTSAALLHATNASGSWVTTTIEPAFANGIGFGLSIAIAADGPHVAYTWNGMPGREARHAYQLMGAWVTETVDSGGTTGFFPAIAVDDADALHIVFRDQTDDLFRHATHPAGSWVLATIDSGGQTGWQGALAFDGAGVAHVAWEEHLAGELHYASDGAGSWAEEPITMGAAGTGFRPYLALDPAVGQPLVAYASATAPVSFAARTGAGWKTAAVVPAASNNRPWLAVDAGGTAQIAFSGTDNMIHIVKGDGVDADCDGNDY